MTYLVLALLVSSSLAAPHRGGGGGGRGGRGNRPFYYGSSRPQSAFNLPSQGIPGFNYPNLGQNQPSIENFGQNIPNFGQNIPNLGGQSSIQQQQQLAQLAQQFPG